MDELMNQLVWIHPKITDPQNKQGNFGRIMMIQPERNQTVVSFENGHIGKYQLDTLFLLKPSILLLEHIYGKKLANWNDHRSILDIYYLAQTGKTESIEMAIEMATRNMVIADTALVSVREWLELQLARIMDRHTPAVARGR
ncbi:hypothetical protein ACS126_03285 [Sphingobacterium lactis]|uniref:hypothetical protein n=1 Tax=Sphingobacterium TaxID=28453 RepID=UPI0021A6B52E|nr:hypothetical protein [Sphingobacterium hotanense]MCT1525823.1 hypothetical protein [Sphingobacterium hotanense]